MNPGFAARRVRSAIRRASSTPATFLAAAFFAGLAGRAREARGAGLYVFDRGVRPLGRGGAFVAGADDAHAIWYNPAGLADAEKSVLFDAAYVDWNGTFTRKSNVTDSNGVIRQIDFPSVKGTTPFLPIPTLIGTLPFGQQKDFTAAFGVYAPYAALASWPDKNTFDAPSRYSIVSMDGSILAVVHGALAWKPTEKLRIGVGIEAMVGQFASTVVFNASPSDRVVGAPEDPQYDSTAKISAAPIVAPSANAGVTWVPDKLVRLGLAYQLPFWINAPAHMQVKLPNAALFDNATQIGDTAHVKFTLPAVLRAGIELRPASWLRAEISYVREFWTTHHSIDIVPDNLVLTGITGFPNNLHVAPVSLPRSFENTHSVRLGGEATKKLDEDLTLVIRAGGYYEEAAIPRDYLAPLTVDTQKVVVAVGASLHTGKHWRFDALLAHAFTPVVEVDPATAAVPHVNPVRGNPTPTEAINGGTYTVNALVAGLGANYKF